MQLIPLCLLLRSRPCTGLLLLLRGFVTASATRLLGRVSQQGNILFQVIHSLLSHFGCDMASQVFASSLDNKQGELRAYYYQDPKREFLNFNWLIICCLCPVNNSHFKWFIIYRLCPVNNIHDYCLIICRFYVLSTIHMIIAWLYVVLRPVNNSND